MWILRFGPKTLEGKHYLHGLTHLWELEEWCLDNNIPTLELYTMQGTYFSSYALIMTGTEHKNKVLGAHGARHCIIPETKKKGKKAEAQTENEGKIQLEERALELATITGIKEELQIKKPTVDELRTWTPQVTFPSNFRKSDITKEVISIKVQEALKNARVKREPAQTRLPRLGAFKYLACEFRQLLVLDMNQPNPEYCTTY